MEWVGKEGLGFTHVVLVAELTWQAGRGQEVEQLSADQR
jgi:hypothetical protein